MSHFLNAALRFIGAFLLLINAACTLQRPGDLRLEAVFTADRTSIPNYKREAQQGFVQPVGLVIELSTEETYPWGAFVLDGFCGEEKDVGVLEAVMNLVPLKRVS